MLFASIVLMVVGYSMLYAALHGRWEFWKFWFPAHPVPSTAAKPSASSAASV